MLNECAVAGLNIADKCTCVCIMLYIASLNKRAQRALGRSPEKKVKGHSGAIYRGPLM